MSRNHVSTECASQASDPEVSEPVGGWSFIGWSKWARSARPPFSAHRSPPNSDHIHTPTLWTEAGAWRAARRAALQRTLVWSIGQRGWAQSAGQDEVGGRAVGPRARSSALVLPVQTNYGIGDDGSVGVESGNMGVLRKRMTGHYRPDVAFVARWDWRRGGAGRRDGQSLWCACLAAAVAHVRYIGRPAGHAHVDRVGHPGCNARRRRRRTRCERWDQERRPRGSRQPPTPHAASMNLAAQSPEATVTALFRGDRCRAWACF